MSGVILRNSLSKHFLSLNKRSFSIHNEKVNIFRCSESNPINHSLSNEALFYSVPEEEKSSLFTYGGLPKTFQTQSRTFNETCIMIRKPAVEIINALKYLDYSKPPSKFLLFGSQGNGKSLTLAHILHYGYKAGFLLIHVPWVGNWMRRCKELSVSVMEEGLTDLNIDAALWLNHFKNQNSHLLSNDSLRISNDYEWNRREITKKNSSLKELIDFGINRVKYASYVTVVLANEIKKLSSNGHCKTLVVIDGFNAFFHSKTRIFKEKKEIVPPENVTLTKAFLNVCSVDWKNAAMVLTVDEIAIGELESPSYLPKYLLGKEGFEFLDPFIPISVENYSEKELLSCIEYYKERKWIQQYYPGLEDELAFVSNSNPYKLLQIAAPL